MSTRLDRDPEIPLASGDGLALPVVPEKLAAAQPALVDRVASEYPQILASTAARRYATAYDILNKWPEALWNGLGKDFTLLSGFLEYKAEFYNDAVDDLRRCPRTRPSSRAGPRCSTTSAALTTPTPAT